MEFSIQIDSIFIFEVKYKVRELLKNQGCYYIAFNQNLLLIFRNFFSEVNSIRIPANV